MAVKRDRRPLVSDWVPVAECPCSELYDKVRGRKALTHLPPPTTILMRTVVDGPSTTVILSHCGEVVGASSRRCPDDTDDLSVGVHVALGRALVALNDQCATSRLG